MAYTLHLAESGTPAADVCRQMGIAEATFYLWKKKYGSLGAADPTNVSYQPPGRRRLSRSQSSSAPFEPRSQ